MLLHDVINISALLFLMMSCNNWEDKQVWERFGGHIPEGIQYWFIFTDPYKGCTPYPTPAAVSATS